jgi:hypothetical protein
VIKTLVKVLIIMSAVASLPILSLTGCGSYPKEQNSFPSESGEANIYANKKIGLKNRNKCKEGSHLNYDNFGEAFFLNYCTSCHSSDLKTSDERLGAPSHINLDTPQGVELNRIGVLLSTKAYLQGSDETNMVDRNNNGIPDKIEDHNNNGTPDLYEDENGNGVPDLYERDSKPYENPNKVFVKMPPSEILPQDDLKLLRLYLECGAASGSDNIR